MNRKRENVDRSYSFNILSFPFIKIIEQEKFMENGSL